MVGEGGKERVCEQKEEGGGAAVGMRLRLTANLLIFACLTHSSSNVTPTTAIGKARMIVPNKAAKIAMILPVGETGAHGTP